MPDISMCQNQTCPLKENCYRFKAEPNMYQTYASFEPDEKGNCDYYWKIANIDFLHVNPNPPPTNP